MSDLSSITSRLYTPAGLRRAMEDLDNGNDGDDGPVTVGREGEWDMCHRSKRVSVDGEEEEDGGMIPKG